MLQKDYKKVIEYYEEALTLMNDQGSSKEAAYHNRCLGNLKWLLHEKIM